MSKYAEIFHHEGEWANKTFGPETELGPEGPLKHLLKEIVVELLGHSIDMRVRDVIAAPPRQPERLLQSSEYADLELLLMDAVRRAYVRAGAMTLGVSIATQHLTAVEVKLEINMTRTWGALNAAGFAEHVRETAQCPVCWQHNIELDSAGRFVTHTQAGFRCPNSGGTP